jgi:ankyrin repeat protein
MEQLHWAVVIGRLEIVVALIELRANVNGELALPRTSMYVYEDEDEDEDGIDELVTDADVEVPAGGVPVNVDEEQSEDGSIIDGSSEVEDEEDEEDSDEEDSDEEDWDDPATKVVTPLFRACRFGYIDIACKLLDSGADIDWVTPNEESESALKFALNHLDGTESDALHLIVQELLRRGARCDLPGPSGDVLGEICQLDVYPDEHTVIAMVGDAIRNGADINGTVGVGKWTPLSFVAMISDRPALMGFLLAQGVVDQSPMGCRALIEVARSSSRKSRFKGQEFVSRQMQTVRLLLQHGAVIDGISEQWYGMNAGCTALHYAYAKANFDVAKQLERAGALLLPDPNRTLPWECRDEVAYIEYMDSRWQCRKAFVFILRELGLTSGAAGAGGVVGEVPGVLLRMLSTREVQSNIASYL